MSLIKSNTNRSFYLWLAFAMNCTVFLGFWFTYFEPLSQGTYSQVSPLVHVHGWTFFVWYPLLMVQIGLIRSGQVKIHRTVGLFSIGLAVIMIAVGLIVSTVRIEMALRPDGDPFWMFMGLPIFSIWVLFTLFYSTAIYYRRRVADHKRLMILASAVALSAATFRIVVKIFGFEPWSAILGMFAPTLFIFAAMIHDYQSIGKVHRLYQWGVSAMFGLIGGMCLLVLTNSGEVMQQGLGCVGRLLSPFY